MGIHRTLAAHYRTLLERTVGITTPDEEFNVLYKWAIVGADRFVAYTPGVGTGLLAGLRRPPADGTAHSGTADGRDMPGTSVAMLHGPALLLTGSVMSQQCGTNWNCISRSRTGAGKIFHELMTSGVVHFDASDATPMYVMLAGHYMRASGDTAFIRASWPHITKAMEFLFSTDTDGDGLIENTDVGHGWVEPGGDLFGDAQRILSVGAVDACPGRCCIDGLPCERWRIDTGDSSLRPNV